MLPSPVQLYYNHSTLAKNPFRKQRVHKTARPCIIYTRVQNYDLIFLELARVILSGLHTRKYTPDS